MLSDKEYNNYLCLKDVSKCQITLTEWKKKNKIEKKNIFFVQYAIHRK